jgi:hypothetical protein
MFFGGSIADIVVGVDVGAIDARFVVIVVAVTFAKLLDFDPCS